MARKSGWQNFADNFNSVYGTFNKVGQNIESKRIMDDEKFTAEGAKGHGLSGNPLEKARYKALGDIYTKYGNAKDGLAVRQQLSNLESSERANELGAATLQEQIRQNGLLQSALMQSQAYQNTASGNASNANANQTNLMTPGKVANLAARTRTSELGNEFTEQTQPGLIEKTNAESDEQVALINEAAQQRKTESGFLTQISDPEYWKERGVPEPTPDQRQAALVEMYENSDIPIDRQMAVTDALQKHGIDKLQNTALQTAEQAKAALSKGVGNLVKWYDGVDDGDATSLELRETDNGFALFQKSGTGDDAQESVLFEGRDQAEIAAMLMGRIQDPGSGIEIANAILDRQQKEADLSKTGAETDGIEAGTDYQNIVNDTAEYSEILAQDNTAARTELAQAQVAKLKQETESEAGVSWNDKAARKAYNSFVTSETYNTLAEEFKDEPVKFTVYTNRVKMGLGLIKSSPADVNEEEWLAMTDAERASF